MKKVKNKKTDALSDGDIEKIGNLLDNAFDGRLKPINAKLGEMATKVDLNEVREELKQHINDGIESVMDGMDRLSEQFAEKKEWTGLKAGLSK